MIQVWRSEELIRNDLFDETVCQFSMRFTWSSGLSNVACTNGDLFWRMSVDNHLSPILEFFPEGLALASPNKYSGYLGIAGNSRRI